MRCYFVRLGHIAGVEALSASSDAEAIEQAKVLFQLREGRYDGFEIWELGRFVYRYESEGGTGESP